MSAAQRKQLALRTLMELVEFLSPPKYITNEEYEGRKSGSLLWRLQRGETDILCQNSDFIWKPSHEEVSYSRIQYIACGNHIIYILSQALRVIICEYYY